MIYANSMKWTEQEIKTMTKEQFISSPAPAWGKFTAEQQAVMKSRIYDQLTLDPVVFGQNVKDGMYAMPKSKEQIMQETIDALVIASLEV